MKIEIFKKRFFHDVMCAIGDIIGGLDRVAVDQLNSNVYDQLRRNVRREVWRVTDMGISGGIRTELTNRKTYD